MGNIKKKQVWYIKYILNISMKHALIKLWSNLKYNNAKRSIPGHPIFVNDTHRDFHLWPVASKINRVYHG